MNGMNLRSFGQRPVWSCTLFKITGSSIKAHTVRYINDMAWLQKKKWLQLNTIHRQVTEQMLK